MNANELLDMIGEAREEYVFDAQYPQTRRRFNRPLLIAAIVVLVLALVGCTVAIFTLQDLKIGEHLTGYGEILDSEGNVLIEEEMVRYVLSLHGLSDSPTFLAHREWYDFYETYSENHVITEEENFFIPPEEYEAYTAYNQELMDKIDEIAEKYNLKLLGAFAPFQRWESSVFHEATGVETYLIPDSAAVIEQESGYFYEGGNFKVSFNMMMPDEDGNWPYKMLNTIYYSKSDYFDTVTFGIIQTKDLEQWNETTSAGDELLIIRPKSGMYAVIICVREDAIIYLNIETTYENSQGDITCMTKRQLKQVVEQFDFSLRVESVDMDLAKAKLEKYNNSHYLQESSTEYSSFDDYIAARIGELGESASDVYFTMTDINKDGTDDLIVGTEDKIEAVWMMKYNQMNLVVEYGENYKKLKESWPAMDKMPITGYFGESANKDKYGYREYIEELLSLEHPENSLYVLSDINSDGTTELLIGDKEQLSFVWRVKYYENGHSAIELLSYSMTEQEFNALQTAWSEMERKPVTEYFSE